MANAQTSFQMSTYATTSVSVQKTTSFFQTAAPEGNPTLTLKILQQKIVRNQLDPKVFNSKNPTINQLIADLE